MDPIEQINANTALITEAMGLARQNRRAAAATCRLAVDLIAIALDDGPVEERAAAVEIAVRTCLAASEPNPQA